MDHFAIGSSDPAAFRKSLSSGQGLSKPRLVKQRRRNHGSAATAEQKGSVDSGSFRAHELEKSARGLVFGSNSEEKGAGSGPTSSSHGSGGPCGFVPGGACSSSSSHDGISRSSCMNLSGVSGSGVFVFGSDASADRSLNSNFCSTGEPLGFASMGSGSFSNLESEVREKKDKCCTSSATNIESVTFTSRSGVNGSSSSNSSFGGTCDYMSGSSKSALNYNNGDREKKDPVYTSSISRGTDSDLFIFGSATNSSCSMNHNFTAGFDTKKKNDSEGYVSEADVHKSERLESNSSEAGVKDNGALGENLAFKLPDEMKSDEMKMLNIGTSVSFEKLDRDDSCSSKVDSSNCFVFESSSCNGKALPKSFEEISRSNVRDSDIRRACKDDSSADVFLFGSSCNQPSFSAPNTKNCIAENGIDQINTISDGMQRTHIGTSVNEISGSAKTMDDPCCSKESNIPSSLSQNFLSRRKKRASKNFKLKRGERLRQPACNQKIYSHSVSRNKIAEENKEILSPGNYSPMDFSPHHVAVGVDELSREVLAAQGDSVVSVSNDLEASTSQSFSYGASKDLNIEVKNSHNTRVSVSIADLDATSSIIELHTSDKFCVSEAENSFLNNSSLTDSTDNESASGFIWDSNFPSKFTFAALHSAQNISVASKQRQRRSQMKAHQDLHDSTLNAKFTFTSPPVDLCSLFSSSGMTSPKEKQEHGVSDKSQYAILRPEPVKELKVKWECLSSSTSGAAERECKKWRLRGNHAYEKGHLSKAEEYYTHGVNCVSPTENCRSCIRAVMLCYSNRAASRMSLGRMREALNDCMMAISMDPGFLKAQFRAANCHLALGETEDASQFFKNSLKLGNDRILDARTSKEASDGLQKTQRVADCIYRCTEALRKRTCIDSTNALQVISEALLISPYSEILIEMKAKALLMLGRYEDVIKICEETMESAESNSFLISADGQHGVDSEDTWTSEKIWRWLLISKSYFYMGKLEEVLSMVKRPLEKGGRKALESLESFVDTVKELLRLKAAGNEEFQAGRYLAAVESYSTALACGVVSRPFAAICFCNRAAAYQALGQITNAIADCSLAAALDANYSKAISRRATLHDMIRDYEQASSDLKRLIALLKRQSEDKGYHCRAAREPSDSSNEIKQAYRRLTGVEEKSRKELPLNMYMILGIESSSSAMDIKKAYHKAALRHHPDKSGQFLIRRESSDDCLWGDVAEEVHSNADHLFKIIGEAYATLSDPTKRLQYDEGETVLMKSNSSYASRSSPEFCRSQSEKYRHRQRSQYFWKSYGSPDQRSSESSRFSQYF